MSTSPYAFVPEHILGALVPIAWGYVTVLAVIAMLALVVALKEAGE